METFNTFNIFNYVPIFSFDHQTLFLYLSVVIEQFRASLAVAFILFIIICHPHIFKEFFFANIDKLFFFPSKKLSLYRISTKGCHLFET
jgi:hypothetical protein